MLLRSARGLRLVAHSQVEVLEARINKNGDHLFYRWPRVFVLGERGGGDYIRVSKSLCITK